MAQPTPSSIPHVEFGGVTPILRVTDLEASLAFYIDALGFKIDWRTGDRHAAVRRGNVVIMLFADDQGQLGTWLYVGIDDVDALHIELLEKGVPIRHPPTNYPWGARELQVADVDGHVLRFGSDATEEPVGSWRDGHGNLWLPQPDGSWQAA
jgi:catechol 2,3-dioxygenase-like lactoylglutathione lyase family enzyme